MDNYRAWFKAKTDTFKVNYCSTVDNYFDLVLSQIEAFTSRTGDESPRELSEMIRHMEDTNTLYQQQLDWLSRRYFDSKATFDVISNAINDATSFTNPIILSDPNTGDSYQVNAFSEYSTNQPQQINDANEGKPKHSDIGFLGSLLSTGQFVSLLPSNHNIRSLSTLPSPSVTWKEQIELQQKSASMSPSGGPYDTVSFVNAKNREFQCVSGCECHRDNEEVHVKEELFEEDSFTRSRKRAYRPAGKLSTSKRVAVEPVADAAEEDEVNVEAESVRLSVIVHHLNCPEAGCTQEFPNSSQLNGHLWSKHQMLEFRCKVKDCGLSFASKSGLLDHRKEAHRHLKDWPCAQCATTWKSYHDLCSHFSLYHEEGRFDCSAHRCDFTGKARVEVYSHKRKHRPAKYECTFAGCRASFKQRSHLTRHLLVHNPEKGFTCEECQKRFTRSDHLSLHKRIHSGVKPYTCTWTGCDYSARDRKNVNAHVRTVHFGLPVSKKVQAKRRIIDNRDAQEFIEKMTTN